MLVVAPESSEQAGQEGVVHRAASCFPGGLQVAQRHIVQDEPVAEAAAAAQQRRPSGRRRRENAAQRATEPNRVAGDSTGAPHRAADEPEGVLAAPDQLGRRIGEPLAQAAGQQALPGSAAAVMQPAVRPGGRRARGCGCAPA